MRRIALASLLARGSGSTNCTALGEALCTADGACAAFGVLGAQIQLHGCATLVANADWAVYVRDGAGSYARVPGHVNVDEDACTVHPHTGSEHACAAPPAPPPYPLVNHGVIDAATGESSIQWWVDRLVIMESIFCG